MFRQQDAISRRVQALLAEVAPEIRDRLPRRLLESLVLRFDAARPDAPPEELAEFLDTKARGWRELRGDLEGLAGGEPGLAGARWAVTRTARAEFDDADALLSAAEASQGASTPAGVRNRAELRRLRARVLLMKGDTDGAAEHVEAAADLLRSLEPGEAAALCHAESEGCYQEALHVGGTGAAHAIELLRRSEAFWTREADPKNWLRTQVCLGLALTHEGWATEGDAGEALLAQAVGAHRAMLEVFTREARPADWAMAQISLGYALLTHAERSPDAEELTEQAMAAFRTPRERPAAVLPENWPGSQFDHGQTILHRARDRQGKAATPLFAEAAAAFRFAMQDQRAVDPVFWGAAQSNLALALGGLAGDADDGTAVVLLAEAAAAYRAALEVFSRGERPDAWARTQHDLGLTLAEHAGRTEEPALFGEAISAFRAAMEVYTPEDQPLEWAGAQCNMGALFERMGDRNAEAPALSYRQAWNCIEAGRAMFWAQGCERYEEECQESLSRLEEKIASAESGAQP